ncbi:MAG: hypothetical protein Q8941_02120 [Bacteroidota bacterium]|nr:hypothetical protein [Bacteroidota bacterium]
MPETENLGSFFKENKKLVREYLDTRLEIYKLKIIRIFSKSAGYFIWIIISLFLLFLFIIFLGLVTGFWLSDLTGSYVKGFGLTTLFILVVILVLAFLRKTLFVNPIIRAIISRASDNDDESDDEK